MQFVKTEDLKIGMRLARPIYNKKGVLLFDRNSLLTAQTVDSIRNFGLIGIYVLEPAEPLPPMSEEDLEFERFQTTAGFSIQEELERLLGGKSQKQLQHIANTIIKNYGHLDEKVNFYQNLRSREDYVYRHSLNVAILCSMMSHVLNLHREEQLQTVCAAIVHDIGKVQYPSESVYGDVKSDEDVLRLFEVQMQAGELIEQALVSQGSNTRRICAQATKAQMDFFKGEVDSSMNKKMLMAARILLVANRYDEMTAMNLKGNVQSEVKAIQEFMDNPEVYDPAVVSALVTSINILFPGVSIELNTGEKALVLVENMNNILRPVVLSFRDNSILDLSLPVYEDIVVVDIMKTLDNRYVMDTQSLHQAGFQ